MEEQVFREAAFVVLTRLLTFNHHSNVCSDGDCDDDKQDYKVQEHIVNKTREGKNKTYDYNSLFVNLV